MNHRMIRLALVGGFAGWLPLVGCSYLAPARDPSRYFTLAALPDAERVSARAPSEASSDVHGIMYGLGPIKVPAYLDRNEIATRQSPSEMTYSATDYWAEPLQANVSRVLLQNLSTLLETDRIATYPWPATVKVAYQVQVELLRFERDAAGEAWLNARWAIRAGTGGGLLVIKESNLSRPATARSTAESVAALSGTLGELSQEIAAALRQLPPPPPPDTKPAKKRM